MHFTLSPTQSDTHNDIRIQTPEVAVLLFEKNTTYRTIHLDGRALEPEFERHHGGADLPGRSLVAAPVGTLGSPEGRRRILADGTAFLRGSRAFYGACRDCGGSARSPSKAQLTLGDLLGVAVLLYMANWTYERSEKSKSKEPK